MCGSQKRWHLFWRPSGVRRLPRQRLLTARPPELHVVMWKLMTHCSKKMSSTRRPPSTESAPSTRPPPHFTVHSLTFILLGLPSIYRNLENNFEELCNYMRHIRMMLEHLVVTFSKHRLTFTFTSVPSFWCVFVGVLVLIAFSGSPTGYLAKGIYRVWPSLGDYRYCVCLRYKRSVTKFFKTWIFILASLEINCNLNCVSRLYLKISCCLGSSHNWLDLEPSCLVLSHRLDKKDGWHRCWAAVQVINSSLS